MTAGRIKNKFQLFTVTPFSGFVFKEKVLTMMKTYLLPLLLLCLLLPYPVSGTLPLYPSWTRIAACSFIAGLMVWFYLLSYPERCLRLKKADILMACYCIYLLVNDALCSPFHHSEKIAGIAALFLLYLLVRLDGTRHRLWLLLLFPAIGLLRFIYCYIYQLSPFPGSHLYQATGGFFNTSLWGGYLAIALSIHTGLGMQGKLFRANLFRWSLWCIGFCCLTGLLFYSDSRAAWLACATGIALSLYCRFPDSLRRLLYRHKITAGILMVVILCISFLFLYRYKQASADGRLQIHRVTFDMLRSKPVTGLGSDGFSRHYMDYQADYFRKHLQTPGIQLADETIFAFNEYLRLLTEHGLIKGILILGMFVFILTRPAQHAGDSLHYLYRNALFSLIVFGFFSYPFSFFEFNILAVILLAGFVSGSRADLQHRSFPVFIPRLWAIGILGIGIFVAFYSYQRAQACEKWNHALSVFSDTPQQALNVLHNLYPVLADNPVFLFTYGKALNLSNQYSHALPVLQQSLQQRSSYQTLIETGKSLAALKQHEAARQCWEKAAQMLPNRLLPDYLLIEMYIQNNQTLRASQAARKALQKKIKTHTPETRFMLRKIKKWSEVSPFF